MCVCVCTRLCVLVMDGTTILARMAAHLSCVRTHILTYCMVHSCVWMNTYTCVPAGLCGKTTCMFACFVSENAYIHSSMKEPRRSNRHSWKMWMRVYMHMHVYSCEHIRVCTDIRAHLLHVYFLGVPAPITVVQCPSCCIHGARTGGAYTAPYTRCLGYKNRRQKGKLLDNITQLGYRRQTKPCVLLVRCAVLRSRWLRLFHVPIEKGFINSQVVVTACAPFSFHAYLCFSSSKTHHGFQEHAYGCFQKHCAPSSKIRLSCASLWNMPHENVYSTPRIPSSCITHGTR